MSGTAVEAGILDFAQALEVVSRHAALLHDARTERVALQESVGRVLAQEVAADRDQPPFDRSTRDGFAVRASEWTAGQRLKVAGQLRAGEEWQGGELAAGCAVEIMTGAPVPAGLDAVAMIEHVGHAGGQVWREQERPLEAGENVVKRGSEARAGSALLSVGRRIGAAEVALAAACGYAEVEVCERPKVAIIATGDELVELNQTPNAYQIRNSNSYALGALVEAAGGLAERLEIAQDTREDIRERVAQGRMWDLMILSGGVSAGKYDLVEEVLAEAGAEFLFTGVKMQPGKPVVFGRLPQGDRDGRWTYFFGLPGNPISTQVTFHCFVEPLLRALGGDEADGPRFVQATLAVGVSAKPGLTRILPAALQHDFVRPEVKIVGWQGSGDLAANARANCYAVVPAGRELKAGDVITVLLR